MRVVTRWVLALLAVVAVGVGVEASVSRGSPTALGTVEGVLRVTHASCPRPAGWGAGCSVSFDRYIRDNLVVIPCTGSEGDGGQVCTLPTWSGPPSLRVSVPAGGRFAAALPPGKYEVLGYPCGEATVVVTAGVTVDASLACDIEGTLGQIRPTHRLTSAK